MSKCTIQSQLNKMYFVYHNTPRSGTWKTPAQLMFVHSTRLQFDTLLPNTSEVVVEGQISQMNSGGNTTVSFDVGDEASVIFFDLLWLISYRYAYKYYKFMIEWMILVIINRKICVHIYKKKNY